MNQQLMHDSSHCLSNELIWHKHSRHVAAILRSKWKNLFALTVKLQTSGCGEGVSSLDHQPPALGLLLEDTSRK